VAVPVSLWRLLAVFGEIGSVLYGSGYVLLAFLQRNLVDDLGWLTSRQLLDAIAVGQVTPGPVFTTATFVGWQIHGVAGAAVATLGIFGPSFVFVSFLGRLVPWMRARPNAKAFLRGVTTASLGLMAGAGSLLPPSGVLVTYGPYLRGGAHTAPSNEAFDASLRARNALWGVRDIDQLVQIASHEGLALEEVVPMRANNFTLVWRKSGTG
jgi:hypothetical protein